MVIVATPMHPIESERRTTDVGRSQGIVFMATQIKTFALECVDCGAKLDISKEMDRFACSYCGTEQIVERRGGTVSLKLLTDAIRKMRIVADKTAAELALTRLKAELADSDKQLRGIKKRYYETSDKLNNITRSKLSWAGRVVFCLVGAIAVSWFGSAAAPRSGGNIPGTAEVVILLVLGMLGTSVVAAFTIRSQIKTNERTGHELEALDSQKRTAESRSKAIENEIVKNKLIVNSSD
jgi:predicted RNA-binding Zn-ribbon protein involved in translation (DUF1610 family)